jgi:prepilin-type N-terminal cleavage/methylation domain-containing protein
MIYKDWKRRYQNQAGFTLIEVIVSLAITGFIGLGASMAATQVMTETSRNRDYTTASHDAMNAMYWLSRDAQMAQVINGSSGFPETSPLSMLWTDWDGVSHNATYSFMNGALTRTYNVDGQITQTLIAAHVSPAMTSTNCTSDNGTITLTITSTVGQGLRAASVTRVREMTSRPKL